LLDAGAGGYLLKSAAERELIYAVRGLAHGDAYMQPSAARVLGNESSQEQNTPTSAPNSRSSPSASRTF